jgi:hypothetical protein
MSGLDSMGTSGSKARIGRTKIYSDIIVPPSPELAEKTEELRNLYSKFRGLVRESDYRGMAKNRVILNEVWSFSDDMIKAGKVLKTAISDGEKVEVVKGLIDKHKPQYEKRKENIS